MTRPETRAATLPPKRPLKRLEIWLRGDAPAEIRRRGARVSQSEAPWGHHAPTRAQRRIIGLARSLPVFRAAIRIHAALWLDNLRPGPIDDLLFGARIRFYPMLAASFRHMLLSPDAYEAEERAFLAAHVGDGAFVDIGANAGIYSLSAAGYWPGRPVIAFEPLDLFAGILERNAAMAGFAHLRVVRAAAGGEDGTLEFSPSQQSVAYGADAVKVPSRSLLSVLREQGIGQVAALKIDAECIEDQILYPFFEGAPEALWPRAIVIEYAGGALWQRDCMALLARQGYREIFRNRLNAGLVRAP
ncbi:MAG TPA: FkbM family methyltransferase [Paracoccaceae bacterium]|nr:FkbM family methyltransferase [Paracoccaceae bacterium]